MKLKVLLSSILLLSALSIQALESGKYYRIVNTVDSNKSLFVQNASLDDGAAVVLWTETDVQAQQWYVYMTSSGRSYMRNAYSGKYLAVSGSNLVQSDTRSYFYFDGVEGDTTQYYIRQSSKYLSVDETGDGTQIGLSSTKMAWKLVPVETHETFDESIRQQMAKGFLGHFMTDKGTGYRTFVNGSWGESETQEAILDMYEGTGDREYLNVYKSCYSYFKYHVGDTWTGGTQVDGYSWYGYDFNDDVMWQIIGAARAGVLTGDISYVEDAKRNFNLIYDRALLSYAGLLRWAESSGNRNGANSCVNGPAEVAACYIAIAEADESYYEIAKSLYAHQRQYLYEPETGHVYDAVVFNPDDGSITSKNTWCSTYNQGTMLGAATLLYQHYGDEQYKTDAQKILAYAQSHLCDENGIINVCQNVDGDFQGFKGILMRYAGLYARVFGDEDTRQWVLKNAQHAYNNGNSHHYSHSAWLTKATENGVYGDTDYTTQAFGASTCISAAFSVPVVPFAEAQDTLSTSEVSQNSNGTISFDYSASRAGMYLIKVFYGSSAQITYHFVALKEGSNAVSIEGKEGLTVDHLTVWYLAPFALTQEAEYGETSGKVQILSDEAASATRYVGSIGSGLANCVTFYVDVPEAADYEMGITYFTASSKNMFVQVNDGERERSTYARTGSNAQSEAEQVVNISLEAGTNTIVLGNNTGTAPYVDKISIREPGSYDAIIAPEANTQSPLSGSDSYYDLSGRQTTIRGTKGIYIHNARKVLRK